MISRIWSYQVLLAVMLSLFSIDSKSFAQDKPVKLILKFDPQKSHRLRKDCFGANVQMHTAPIEFDHPDMIAAYTKAGNPFFRFPGGTFANYYDPMTGMLDEKAPSHHNWIGLNKAIRERKGDGGNTAEPFFSFARKTGARYSVVLNVSTMSLEQNRKWLSELSKQGVEVPAFEIGNELYYGSYSWAIKTPEDYLKIAKEYTAMIRELFPKTKIGVIVPSHVYTSESFLAGKTKKRPGRNEKWYALLKKENFYDAVIIHLYSNLGMNRKTKKEDFLSFQKAYANSVGYLERNMSRTLNYLEKTFPEKAIWITEYGVGGFGGPLRQYGLRHSHLGCLHSDLMLLRFLSRPSVTVSHWHSFTQCLVYDRSAKNISGYKLQYHHLSLFADPVNSSDTFVPVVSDSSQVEAAAFTKGKNGYLIILNKMGKTYFIDKANLKNVRFTAGLRLSPGKNQPLSESLQNETSMDQTKLTDEQLVKVTIPPYSITRLQFQSQSDLQD